MVEDKAENTLLFIEKTKKVVFSLDSMVETTSTYSLKNLLFFSVSLLVQITCMMGSCKRLGRVCYS